MATFVFWNLNRKPLEGIVANLAIQYEVDVFMLAECTIPPGVLLRELNRGGSAHYHYARSLGCKVIHIYTRFTAEFIRAIREGPRFTIRHIKLPGAMEILLAVSHFPSKLYWDDDSQAAESVVLAEEVERAEAKVGHQQTVLVGDLNMNPFESGLVSAKGLHAVMSRDVAAKGHRIVQNKSYQFFYNPMWSFLGDASIGPPGTYYYSDSSHKIFFWNMFDQVLVRPSLLNYFSNEEVRILESDGVNSLLSSTGLPNADAASDHLPVMFAINL